MKKSILFLSLTPFLLAGCGDTELEKVQKAYQDYKNYERQYLTEHHQNYKDIPEDRIKLLKGKLKLCEKVNDLIYEYRNNGAEGAKTRKDIFPHFSVNSECDKYEEYIQAQEKILPLNQKIVKYLKAEIKKYDGLTWQQVIEKTSKKIREEKGEEAWKYYVSEYRDEEKLKEYNQSYEEFENKILSDHEGIELSGEKKEKLDFDILIYIYWVNAHKGFSELQQKTYEQILDDKSLCKKDRRDGGSCSIQKVTLEAKSKEVVIAYTKNFAKLKQDFNQCLATWAEKSQQGVESHEFWQSYPCYQAREAVEKLNFSTSKPLN